MTDFLDIAHTPAILRLQEAKGSLGLYRPESDGSSVDPEPHHIDDHEAELITSRDSFYMATVNEDGWPYVQHRGGEPGFVKQLDAHTIGWVERNGNRQYLGTGNITANGRVAAIFVDYPSRTRLKVLGRATHHPVASPELLTALGAEDVRNDGAITIEVVATNWNCPKYITPRFTEQQVSGALGQLQDRIAELESELAALRAD